MLAQLSVMPCDVTDDASVEAVFDQLKSKWGSLDFVLTPLPIQTKKS